MLVDGFLAPTGNCTGIPDLYSGKRHSSGMNVQAVPNLAGRLLDSGLPVPGARHDSKALAESGTADRWANHLRPGGPGMLADLGYLGTAAITGTRKPRGGELGDVRRACNQRSQHPRRSRTSNRAPGQWKSSTPAGADALPTSPTSYYGSRTS
ncbi:transposase family protein [Phytohabitans houttuyneae]|uniref:transposase family protein n=1 Tax=Phytohabitans houttuyneae TaxID=1076126 RepID=UPI001566DC88|nr:transposase family protein [Phytohabitans houttuyneae]